MDEKDAFTQRERVLEDVYFRKRDEELIEKMREEERAEKDRRVMARVLGTSDELMLKELQRVGYSAETVILLHLVPFIEVAWTEDGVSRPERELILQAAGLRGVTKGSPAYGWLKTWLDKRPDQEFFATSLRGIRCVLDALRPKARAAAQRSLLERSTAIAAATGGVRGFRGKISDDERKLLKRIAEALTPGDEAPEKPPAHR